jgi:hypothetical protein
MKEVWTSQNECTMMHSGFGEGWQLSEAGTWI